MQLQWKRGVCDMAAPATSTVHLATSCIVVDTTAVSASGSRADIMMMTMMMITDIKVEDTMMTMMTITDAEVENITMMMIMITDAKVANTMKMMMMIMTTDKGVGDMMSMDVEVVDMVETTGAGEANMTTSAKEVDTMITDK